MAWNRSRIDNGKLRIENGGKSSILNLRFAIVAVLILVVTGGVAWWWASQRGDDADRQSAPEPSKTKPVQIATAVPPVSSDKPAESALPEVADGQVSEQQEEEKKKPGVFAPGMIRLPNGYELRFKLPAEGETRQLLAGGEIWEIDSKGNIENVTPPPVFEKPFEGMISSLYERDGMVLPFALKRYSEAEVRKMCKEPTLSYDDDTPEITRKRENVAALKKAILDFLDGGGTFEEFVDDMLQHSQKSQRAQIEGVHGVRDLLVAGKDKEAVQYYKLFSQDMADKGYGELKLPRSYRAALEEIESKEKGGK